MKGTGQSVTFHDHAEWRPRGMADAGIDGSRRGRSLEGNEEAATRPGLLNGVGTVGLGPRKAPSPPPMGHKERGNGSRTLAGVSRWSFLVAGGAGACCKLLQDHAETVRGVVTGQLQLGCASQFIWLAPDRWDAGTVIVLGMIAILAASVARDSRRPMRGCQLVSPLTPRLSAVAAVIFMVVCIHQVPSTCHSALQEMWQDAHPKDELAQAGAAAAAAVAAAPMKKSSIGDAAGGGWPGSAGATRAADGTRPPLFETSPSPSPSPRTSPSPPHNRRSGAGEGGGTAGWGNNGSASVSKLGQGDKAAAKDVGVDVCVGCDMPGGSPRMAAGKAGLAESW